MSLSTLKADADAHKATAEDTKYLYEIFDEIMAFFPDSYCRAAMILRAIFYALIELIGSTGARIDLEKEMAKFDAWFLKFDKARTAFFKLYLEYMKNPALIPPPYKMMYEFLTANRCKKYINDVLIGPANLRTFVGEKSIIVQGWTAQPTNESFTKWIFEGDEGVKLSSPTVRSVITVG